MSLTETVLEGTIQADGTLVLDEPTKLPEGRVKVILQVQQPANRSISDGFWQRMQSIWDAQDKRGHVPRTVEEVEAERREVREAGEERLRQIEAIREEARLLRESAQSES